MMPIETYWPVPVEGSGRWQIMSGRNEVVLGHTDYATRELAAAALQDLLASRGQEGIVRYRPDGTIDRIEAFPRAEGTRQVVRLTIEITPEQNAMIEDMAEEMGVPKGEAVIKALALLQIALEAKRSGRSVAIVEPDGQAIETEITGF